MQTLIISLYEFSELTPAAQKVAITQFSEINIDRDWWDGDYDDAENVGLEISEFSLDRSYFISGEFIESAEHCANLIKTEHGAMCKTWDTADNYLRQRDELVDTAPKDDNGDFEDTAELDGKLDDLDQQFLTDILNCYWSMLQTTYAFLQSDESIIETIECNEWLFLPNGKHGDYLHKLTAPAHVVNILMSGENPDE